MGPWRCWPATSSESDQTDYKLEKTINKKRRKKNTGNIDSVDLQLLLGSNENWTNSATIIDKKTTENLKIPISICKKLFLCLWQPEPRSTAQEAETPDPVPHCSLLVSMTPSRDTLAITQKKKRKKPSSSSPFRIKSANHKNNPPGAAAAISSKKITNTWRSNSLISYLPRLILVTLCLGL